jgi:hypothetical protein
MKKWTWIVVLVASLFLTACGQEGVYSGKLILGGQVLVESDQTETAVVVVLEGNLMVEAGAKLEGDVYQFGGMVILDGELDGDMYLFNGVFNLSSDALVGGNIMLGGGYANIDPAAEVVGEIMESETQLPSEERVASLGRQSMGWRLVQILGVSLGALLVSRFFDRPLLRVANAVRHHPVPAGAMGFLVFVVGLSLLVQMAFTILLIPVSMLGLILFGLAAGYGWIAIGLVIGEALFSRLPIEFTPTIRTVSGTFLVMLFQSLLLSFPIGGLVLAVLINLIGLGSVSLTRFGLQEFVPHSDEAFNLNTK